MPFANIRSPSLIVSPARTTGVVQSGGQSHLLPVSTLSQPATSTQHPATSPSFSQPQSQPFLYRLWQVFFQPNTIRLYISAQILHHVCILPALDFKTHNYNIINLFIISPPFGECFIQKVSLRLHIFILDIQ